MRGQNNKIFIILLCQPRWHGGLLRKSPHLKKAENPGRELYRTKGQDISSLFNTNHKKQYKSYPVRLVKLIDRRGIPLRVLFKTLIK
jgi:hypothetical protein